MGTAKDITMQHVTDAVIEEVKRAAAHPLKAPVIVRADTMLGILVRLEAAEKERDAMRAKIAQMEKQEPAPSDKDEPIRKAWARFSNELHRSPDAPYPGMSEAFEQHFSQSWTDKDWRNETRTWAAAWKAAKNHGAQEAKP